jgi:hypothetical protein
MTTPAVRAPLGLYDVAFLAGGHPRVADAALVEMVVDGLLRAQAPGRLAVADPTPRHPVEAAVLDAIGSSGHRPVEAIRRRLLHDVRLRSVGQRLVDVGLLHQVPWPVVLGTAGRRRPRTREGNGALAAIATACRVDPQYDPTGAYRVAVHGWQALPDAQLRAAIFRPSAPVPDVAAPPRVRRHEQVRRGQHARAATWRRDGTS